jgi:hypothetical protein
MILTGAPKQLWDHCIELEDLICSHNVNDIHAMGGEVSKTIMKEGTGNISQTCKIGWYNWVMFRDTVNIFPDDKMVLGRYLRPATSVGLTLMAKTLNQNGQYGCGLMLHQSTSEERDCSVHIEAQPHFDIMIIKCIGHNYVPGNFDP